MLAAVASTDCPEGEVVWFEPVVGVTPLVTAVTVLMAAVSVAEVVVASVLMVDTPLLLT
jgi:hypothetical protein